MYPDPFRHGFGGAEPVSYQFFTDNCPAVPVGQLIGLEQKFILPFCYRLICDPVKLLQIGVYPLKCEQAEVNGAGIVIILFLRQVPGWSAEADKRGRAAD